MDRSHLKIFLAGCAGVLLCSLIFLTGPQPLEAGLPQSKAQVSIGSIDRTLTQGSLKAFGPLTPRQSLQLTSQVPGEVRWVSEGLVAGGQIDKGEVLLRIDPRDYEIAVANAEARLAQADATIELEQGRSEIARLEWTAWQASVGEDMPASALALRQPQKAEAIALRKAIVTELDRAKLALERTVIRAPWPASVVQANAIAGQVLSVGEVAAVLFPLDFGVVELQVPGSTVHALETGIERVDLYPIYAAGRPPVVGAIEGIVKNLTEDTRLATVRVRVESPLEYEGWAYGMHLTANIITQQQTAIAMVPADLIISGNLIWVYRDGKAMRHQIYPIENSGLAVSVEDNFEPEDSLILQRPIGLFDGAEVVVVDS